MNKVFLIGNLTRDPEIRTTQSGTQSATFTIAVQRRFANKDGEKTTDFINVVAWKQLAEICGRFLRKGSKAAVCGSLQLRSYTDKDDQKRYFTEVIADEVEFLTKAESSANSGSDAQTVASDGYTAPNTGKHIPGNMIEVEDDLPF